MQQIWSWDQLWESTQNELLLATSTTTTIAQISTVAQAPQCSVPIPKMIADHATTSLIYNLYYSLLYIHSPPKKTCRFITCSIIASSANYWKASDSPFTKSQDICISQSEIPKIILCMDSAFPQYSQPPLTLVYQRWLLGSCHMPHATGVKSS